MNYPFKSEVLQYFSHSLLQLMSVSLLVAVCILNVCQWQTISVTSKNKLRRGASASNWIVYSRGTSISHDGRDREKHPSRVCALQLWISSLLLSSFLWVFRTCCLSTEYFSPSASISFSVPHSSSFLFAFCLSIYLSLLSSCPSLDYH